MTRTLIFITYILHILGWKSAVYWLSTITTKKYYTKYYNPHSIKVLKCGMNYNTTMRSSESKKFNKHANKLGFGLVFRIESPSRGTL